METIRICICEDDPTICLIHDANANDLSERLYGPTTPVLSGDDRTRIFAERMRPLIKKRSK